MRFNAARSIACACAVVAAGAFAAVLPATSAAEVGTQCSGENVEGRGSSLQAKAQAELWDPKFNDSKSKKSCSGGKKGTEPKPTVKYESTSSGSGMRTWGIETKNESELKGFGATNAFIGTDEPPDEKQQGEAEAKESTKTAGSLLEIPVAQESVAIIMNLPTGCTAKSEASGATGRLVLNNKTLEEIFAGKIKTWAGIKDDGDKVSSKACEEEPITVVVREDGSGTTHILKRYLDLIEPAKLLIKAGTEETWGELSVEAGNTVWPEEAHVTKPAEKGGGEEINKVLEAPSRIGYVNVAEARANVKFVGGSGGEGGEGKSSFWAELENSAKGKGEKIKYTYQDPAEGGDVITRSNSNCKKTAFTNGTEPVPPPTVKESWSGLTTAVPEQGPTAVKEKTYPLCGLTYDLAFTKYSLLLGGTLKEATQVNNFLQWVVEKKGGQTELLGNDYYPLPKNVDTIAAKGAEEVGF
jgi:ABC-type phosphate transport system substrate-binding protein